MGKAKKDIFLSLGRGEIEWLEHNRIIQKKRKRNIWCKNLSYVMCTSWDLRRFEFLSQRESLIRAWSKYRELPKMKNYRQLPKPVPS